MTHVKRGIFSNIDAPVSNNINRKTVPDLPAVLDFVKHSTLNSLESFDISARRNSNHQWTVEINSLSEFRKEEKSTPKTRVRVPAGLYDLFW